MRTRDILRAARKDGRDAGKAAASWCFDGNTTRETYLAFLKGAEDGDPAVLDRFNLPNLSGEYADDPTPQSLAEDYGISEDDKRAEWLIDDLCTEWENAAHTAFWDELERVARFQVAP